MPQSRKRPTAKGRRPAAQVHSTKPAADAHKGNDNKTMLIAAVAIGALLVVGLIYFLTRGRDGGSNAVGTEVTTASGLKYADIVVGTGESPKPGQTIVVHYTGTLQDGTKFDSSVDRKQPANFVIGRGAVIKGWDEGLMTMKVGGKRRLTVPPKLGYGQQSQSKIPANSTLIFDVELLGIKQ